MYGHSCEHTRRVSKLDVIVYCRVLLETLHPPPFLERVRWKSWRLDFCVVGCSVNVSITFRLFVPSKLG